MTVLRTAYVNVLPKTDDFDPELKKRLRRIDASKEGEHVGSTFGSGFGSKLKTLGAVGVAALGGVVVAAGAAAVGAGIFGLKTAASLEQAQIGFETLLGSGQKASAFLGDLKKFAAATPFELPGLIESSRTLLGVGLDAKQVVPTLKAFGDAAGAVGVGQEAFQRIMLATSQAISAGKFQTEDLNQIMENGIPIWTILSKAMGKPVPELRTLASQGKLLSKDVLPLLEQQMGKDYGGAMARQSQTLAGVWSTLKDTVAIGLADAIQPLVPMLTNLLPKGAKLFGDALKIVSDNFRLFIAGLQGKGPIEGFAGALNTLGLGLRALVAAFKEGGVTSTGFVGAMERIGVIARDAFDGIKQAWVDLSVTFNARQIKVLAGALGVLALSIWAVTAPVSLVVVGIGALVVGFGLAYKHSETFRKIIDVVVAGLRIWADYMLWTWHNVWEPAFVGLGRGALWLWQNAMKPAFDGIRTAISVASDIIRPVLDGLVWYFRNVVGPTVMWLWNNVFGPAFKGISFAVQVAVSIITTLFGAFVALIREVIAPTVMWLWHTIIEPAARGWILAIQTAWNFIRPILEALGNFIRDDLARRIETGVKIIGDLWDSLKAKAETPVRFVVDVVLNNLINAWNTIAKAFGGTRIPPISFGGGGGGGGGGRFMALASGGVYPGYTPGRDVGLAAVSGGEAIMRPEWTRVVGKDYVEAVNAAARSGGTGGVARFLGGYAGGGIIGFLTDPAGWFKDRVGAVGDIARRFGSNPFVEMLAGGSRKLVDAAIEKAKGLLSLGGGPLGGAGGNIGWQAMWNIIHGAFPAAQLFSGYRPGDRAESGSLSYHALGRAIDITPSVVIGRWIAARYGAMTKELIHTPMGGEQIWNGRPYTFTGAALQAAHYNHVHWAMNRGGVVDNSRPQRLDDYTIQRLAQALTGRPVNVAINGPDWGLSVAGWST